MAKRPTFAVRVANLSTSLEFYCDLLGLRLEAQDADSDTTTIVDSLGMPVLLAGPRATDLVPHMGDVREIAAPGTSLYFHEAAIDARMQALIEAGLAGVQLVERRWGERRLVLRDPDGYEVNLWAEVAHTSRGPGTLHAGSTGIASHHGGYGRAGARPVPCGGRVDHTPDSAPSRRC